MNAAGRKSNWLQEYASATVSALTPLATPTTATPTPTPTVATTLCANTGAIPDPEAAGLVADCETLLRLKDELAGSAALNWSVDRFIETGTALQSRVSV